jgi:antitoxin (DNA-binding transcriptional repressor) of toxin-antitoxin stability system
MGKMIGAAEFKAHCLRILKEVRRTGEPVTVTHRGVPIVEVKAMKPETQPAPKLFFGCMKGWIADDLEPEESAYDRLWNAELDSDEDDPGADVR